MTKRKYLSEQSEENSSDEYSSSESFSSESSSSESSSSESSSSESSSDESSSTRFSTDEYLNESNSSQAQKSRNKNLDSTVYSDGNARMISIKNKKKKKLSKKKEKRLSKKYKKSEELEVKKSKKKRSKSKKSKKKNKSKKKTTKRGRNKKYVEIDLFENYQDAIKKLNSDEDISCIKIDDNTWKKRYSKESEKHGEKIYYCCSKNRDCPKLLYLLKHNHNDFIDYFQRQWCSPKRMGWIDHYCDMIPCTTNGLESLNGNIKQTGTLRTRMSVQQLLNVMETGFVQLWSTKRNPNNIDYIKFAEEPTLDLKSETTASQWSKINKKIKKFESNLSTPDSSPITQSPVVEATYEVISSKLNKSSKIVIEKLLASDISIKPKNTEICSECGTTKMRNRYLYCPNKQCSTRIKKK